MAPLPPPKPSARTLRQQRVTGQIHPLLPSKIFRPDAQVSDSFLSNKRDKRIVKHSSFVSRITSARVAKTKRRRPGNKLKASLEGLADALPELADADGEGGAAELAGKVRHKSLRSRKGALKRKERVVKGEMERFGVSMARLTGSGPGAAAPTTRAVPAGVRRDDDDDDEDEDDGDDTMVEQEKSKTEVKPAAAAPTANRWAALRGYISATMEQNPAFAGK